MWPVVEGQQIWNIVCWSMFVADCDYGHIVLNKCSVHVNNLSSHYSSFCFVLVSGFEQSSISRTLCAGLADDARCECTTPTYLCFVLCLDLCAELTPALTDLTYLLTHLSRCCTRNCPWPWRKRLPSASNDHHLHLTSVYRITSPSVFPGSACSVTFHACRHRHHHHICHCHRCFNTCVGLQVNRVRQPRWWENKRLPLRS